MNKKTQIIVSLTGIFIVLFTLIGFTYGYYLTKIEGNSSLTSVDIETGIPGVEYTDLTGDELENIVIKPGVTLTKRFKVTNTGNVKASYSIYLVDVFNNFVRTEDVTYKLYRIGNTETFPTNYSGCITNPTDEMSCKLVVDTTEFPTEVSVVKPNEIITTPETYYTYAMVITYINHPTINQNDDQGHTFSGKINLRPTDKETNPFSEGTLAYNILNYGAQLLDTTNDELYYDKTYIEKTTITKISDGTDREDMGIFTAQDDYGTSYYYRGTVKNNYVSFAGFIWRIVRINGDGTIRLILNDTLDTVTKFNNFNDNAYVGYMYGNFTEKSTSYDEAHKNEIDSIIKEKVDLFYETYIENDTNNYHFGKYLADALFCGDKTLANTKIGQNNTGLGYGTNETYYAAVERLFYSSGYNRVTTATPTLECAKGADNTYSRYTSNSTITSKGVRVNNDLKYPIALLSADETVMAGAWYSKSRNTLYYLEDESVNLGLYWWTMTPYDLLNPAMYVPLNYDMDGVDPDQMYGRIRPVINLKANSLISGGNGTNESPYTIQERN